MEALKGYLYHHTLHKYAILPILVYVYGDGTLSRYKAHLVRNGSIQLEGVDVDETFSPIVKLGMFLSQRKYAVEILERAHMANCNPSRTLVDTESKLGNDVQQVFLHMHDPREPHFLALKRILRFVRILLDHGLQLFPSSITFLVAYSNADWSGCPTTRSVEAEYCGVSNAIAETCWLQNLLRELHIPLSSTTLVYYDNVSAVYLSSNPVQHQHKVFYMDMALETSQAEPEPVSGSARHGIAL
uniref:Ribonuclease H-like domain-containing protein n=1 Tax=Tanacetum cinerariifolium TaxID=118510 RepID=A0A6L2KN56_TANCI|nr:ribonuclease H-like domain-containing protein [Tanacetum cinerariifolium]